MMTEKEVCCSCLFLTVLIVYSILSRSCSSSFCGKNKKEITPHSSEANQNNNGRPLPPPHRPPGNTGRRLLRPDGLRHLARLPRRHRGRQQTHVGRADDLHGVGEASELAGAGARLWGEGGQEDFSWSWDEPTAERGEGAGRGGGERGVFEGG